MERYAQKFQKVGKIALTVFILTLLPFVYQITSDEMFPGFFQDLLVAIKYGAVGCMIGVGTCLNILQKKES